MSEPIKQVRVYFEAMDESLPVGRLALKGRDILFEYDPLFLDSGIELSPFMLPLKAGVSAPKERVFDGLFGLFNDSLPDGWGRLLLDRKLRKDGRNPAELSPLDQLCHVGKSGMGALRYEPEFDGHLAPLVKELDEIADEIKAFQDDDDQYVEDLLVLGGSSAGARPKVLISIEGRDWLVKFRSAADAKDIGAVEYAYHLMAKDAGLETAEAKLFPSKNGQGFFGAKRFDKDAGKSIHMHSISGLLHADHRIPSLDYKTILDATWHLTKDINEVKKQFHHCVFNVLTHNRDDHAKNFAFLMEGQHAWKVSPAYDLTYSFGPGGEHCSTVMGEGRSPGKKALIALAESSSIDLRDAQMIIEQVEQGIMRWEDHAEQAGVGAASKREISKSLQEVRKA